MKRLNYIISFSCRLIIPIVTLLITQSGCEGKAQEEKSGAANGEVLIDAEADKNYYIVERAFEAVQKKASAEAVVDEIKPLFDSGGLNKLTVESKCKLGIVYYYILNQGNDKMSSLINTPGMKEFTQSIKYELDGTQEQQILKSMEGEAHSVFLLMK